MKDKMKKSLKRHKWLMKLAAKFEYLESAGKIDMTRAVVDYTNGCGCIGAHIAEFTGRSGYQAGKRRLAKKLGMGMHELNMALWPLAFKLRFLPDEYDDEFVVGNVWYWPWKEQPSRVFRQLARGGERLS